eukprot:1915847-Rhodomonas_salina.2
MEVLKDTCHKKTGVPLQYGTESCEDNTLHKISSDNGAELTGFRVPDVEVDDGVVAAIACPRCISRHQDRSVRLGLSA